MKPVWIFGALMCCLAVVSCKRNCSNYQLPTMHLMSIENRVTAYQKNDTVVFTSKTNDTAWLVVSNKYDGREHKGEGKDDCDRSGEHYYAYHHANLTRVRGGGGWPMAGFYMGVYQEYGGEKIECSVAGMSYHSPFLPWPANFTDTIMIGNEPYACRAIRPEPNFNNVGVPIIYFTYGNQIVKIDSINGKTWTLVPKK